MNRLNGLSLKQYYFECALIFLNVMLRSSILYACETYYNLKETEVRQIERIEECFLRKILKTTKGCPIAQMYLETGHVPARFEIKKIRLLFLQYILKESPSSLISKFLQLQIENPTRGDWASNCINDLEELKINLSFEEIKMLTKAKFNQMLKKALAIRAFEYLTQKKGSKGIEINYTELKMAEYLMPNQENLSIEDRRRIFEIRNRMLPIPANFPLNKNVEKCWCGEDEDMRHIYMCKYWTSEKEKTAYEMIFSEDVSKQNEVYKQFELNYSRREQFKSDQNNDKQLKNEENLSHVILVNCDPLSSIVEHSNGAK